MSFQGSFGRSGCSLGNDCVHVSLFEHSLVICVSSFQQEKKYLLLSLFPKKMK